MGVKFTERPSDNASGSAHTASTLVAEVVEKGGTLGEISMDQTSAVSPGDEVVAVGGAGGLMKYFKIDSREDNSSSEGSLVEVIDRVAEPVRLQLQRHFDPVKVLHFLTLTNSFFMGIFYIENARRA